MAKQSETSVVEAGEHADVIRRWIDAYNDRDDAGEAAARAPGYVGHAPGEEPLHDEAWRAFIGGFSEAMPDLRITIEDIVADDRFVAARNTFSGTLTGEFQGIPPSGKRITFSALEFNRLVDGKVVEHWVQLDQPALFKQLGLVVIPGPRLLARILVHKLQALRPGSK